MHHHARRAPGDGNPKPSEVLPALVDRGGASPTEPPAGKQAHHYLIRLRSTGSGDDIRRLRWLLKSLLRRFGLRCLSIEEEAQP